METIALFDENIPLTPRDLSRDAIKVRDVLQRKLRTKLEGRCSRDGWVKPGTLNILSHSMGYVESGRFTGDIVYHTKCEGKVINPSADTLVEGEVIRKNKMGVYVNVVDAIRIILPRDHPSHIGNDEYDGIVVGEKVTVMIKKSRFQVNDEYILSVGIFESKSGSGFTTAPQQVVEEQEAPEEEQEEAPQEEQEEAPQEEQEEAPQEEQEEAPQEQEEAPEEEAPQEEQEVPQEEAPQ
jgi:DNA-directed RNA polymerase subunit E'/Rpb7